MALSDLAVRQLKATGKAFTLADFDGLSLSVSPLGGKAWHFRYYWAGKQKRMSFGTYPKIGLREARGLRDEARSLLAKGINPTAHRKQKRHSAHRAAENSFRSVYLIWFQHRRLELKAGRQSTLSQIERIFEKDVLPRLGTLSIFDIHRSALLDVLARIESRGALSIAEKVRTWLKQLFRFALVKVPGLDRNPAADLDVVAVPRPPVVNNPFLRFAELPRLLRQLRAYRGKTDTQLGIRLLLLTGVRTGELRLATPEQFDLEQGLWFIPPEIVKQLQENTRRNRKRIQDVPPYIVPLSMQAIEIIRYLLAQVKPSQQYLLTHRSDLKKRISENTLNGALKRMGYHELLTGHGIRATLSTALNEIGYPKIWVDAQLSHCDPNKVSAAYNHALHVEPRRRMMQDWADRLDMLEQGHIERASRHLVTGVADRPDMSESNHGLATDKQALIDAIELPIPLQRLPAIIDQRQAMSQPMEMVSAVQRERMATLDIYEAPHNLPVVRFAKLAGKSRDQINREIRGRKLLTLNVGNRGQRIPDWQLDPVKYQLTSTLLRTAAVDAWQLHHLLTQAHVQWSGRSALDVVTAENIDEVLAALNTELSVT